MNPIQTTDLARLHTADLRHFADRPEAHFRRAQRDAEPERYPLPPSPRLAVGRLVAWLRAAVHVGAAA